MKSYSIYYLAGIRFPMERANSIQIINTCNAFAAQGLSVHLFVKYSNKKYSTPEIADYYGLQLHDNLNIKYLFTKQYKPGAFLTTKKLFSNIRLGFMFNMFESYLFAKKALQIILRDECNKKVVYTRDIFTCLSMSHLTKNNPDIEVVYEAHHVDSYILAENSSIHTSRIISKLVQLIEKIALKNCKLIVCLNKFVKEDIQSIVQNKQIPCVIAHDGSRVINGKSKKKTYIPKELVYVGQLYKWKNVDIAIRAMKYIDAHLNIVGGLPFESDMSRLQKLVSELHLEDKVTFLGQKSHAEALKLMSKADIGIVTLGDDLRAVRYTSPMKVFEYMETKTPIIAPNLPSINDILTDRHNALLYSPKSPQDLAYRVNELLENSSLKEKLQKRAYVDLEQYRWSNRAKKIVEAIAALLEEKA
jgi:glycosyltransferase involved in cell wall biosynthesis